MRTIGTCQYRQRADRIVSYLRRKGIEAEVEGALDPASGLTSYEIWVHDEDRLEEARGAFTEFSKNPEAALYDIPVLEQVAPVKEEDEEQQAPERPMTLLTYLILFVCGLFFFLDTLQEIPYLEKGVSIEVFSMTPIRAKCLYDFPPVVEQLFNLIQKYQIPPNQDVAELSQEIQQELSQIASTPIWRGVYDWLIFKIKIGDGTLAEGPLFVKIRQGELWRLFSPSLLHSGIFHLGFNMLMLWVLARSVEQRIGFFRFFFLNLFIAAGSNTAQYFMSGFLFLGYSGVLFGLAGFIWMRKREAPWEGYPISSGTLLFLTLYLGALVALQTVSFFLSIANIASFQIGIANTCHIAGGIIGIGLAKVKWLSRRIVR